MIRKLVQKDNCAQRDNAKQLYPRGKKWDQSFYYLGKMIEGIHYIAKTRLIWFHMLFTDTQVNVNKYDTLVTSIVMVYIMANKNSSEKHMMHTWIFWQIQNIVGCKLKTCAFE